MLGIAGDICQLPLFDVPWVRAPGQSIRHDISDAWDVLNDTRLKRTLAHVERILARKQIHAFSAALDGGVNGQSANIVRS